MKNQKITDYKKKNQVKGLFNSGSSQPDSQNLYECVKEIFPDTRPQRLREWREMMEKESVEPEPLLFMASICGTHFRIISPDLQLEDVQEYIYRWLAWGDDMHRMRPDVAELIVEAITPGIKREINARGHQRGLPDGEHFRRKGKIPQFRGAWVAALIIENHLTQTGMELTNAKDYVVKLISVLLEKKEANAYREFSRLYKDAPKDIICDLRDELFREYKFWMIQDGVYGGDLEPPQDQVEKHSEWKARHRSLQNLFKQNGCERFCDLVVSRIKYGLWKPLWDMKAEQIDKDEENK
jgi:hypothetical protein